MAQGQRLTKQHKKYIAEVCHQNPDWVAKEVREQFHNHFGLKGEWPGLSAIQKAVHDIREADNKRSLESKAFDELWSLGSLPKHPIPPEAMPVVMSAYKKALEERGELTIREAQWIARLYRIIDPPDLVLDWAFEYALQEWLSEITGEPIDTTELDLKIVSNPQSAQGSRSSTHLEINVWTVASEHGLDPSTLKDKCQKLNLTTQEQIEEMVKSGKYKEEIKNER